MTNSWEYDYSSLYNQAHSAQDGQSDPQNAQNQNHADAQNTQTAQNAQAAQNVQPAAAQQPTGAQAAQPVQNAQAAQPVQNAQQTADAQPAAATEAQRANSGPAYAAGYTAAQNPYGAQNTAYQAQNPYGTQSTGETVHRTVYEAPKAHEKKHLGKRIAAGALAVVLCGAFGVGGGYLGSMLATKGRTTVVYQAASTAAGSAEGSTAASGATALSISQVASIVGPSVVEVTTESVATNTILGQYVTDGAGSGVVLSADGYIITNNHVIDGAQQIKVTTSDKKEYDATVVGADSQTDIAVLKIDATGLTPAVVGDSDALAVGDTVVAVGNPLGELGGTVTDGIISALDRDITIDNQTMTLLQTNAAVSPGNSGGGLFDSEGQLVGIVNAKSSASNAEGLGFAIPVNTAMKVAKELMENGYVTGRPAMGVSVVEIDDATTAAQYGVSEAGVYIVSVTSGGAADKAGLKVGDRIMSIDGTAVSGTADVTGYLEKKAVGDTVTIQVVRDKQVVSASVTLQESNNSATATQNTTEDQQSSQNQQSQQGMTGGFGQQQDGTAGATQQMPGGGTFGSFSG